MRTMLDDPCCSRCWRCPPAAADRLKVVATTADLAAIATAVGGDATEVTTIARPTEDPHFVDAQAELHPAPEPGRRPHRGRRRARGGLAAAARSTARATRASPPARRGRIVASEAVELKDVPTRLDRSLGRRASLRQPALPARSGERRPRRRCDRPRALRRGRPGAATPTRANAARFTRRSTRRCRSGSRRWRRRAGRRSSPTTRTSTTWRPASASRSSATSSRSRASRPRRRISRSSSRACRRRRSGCDPHRAVSRAADPGLRRGEDRREGRRPAHHARREQAPTTSASSTTTCGRSRRRRGVHDERFGEAGAVRRDVARRQEPDGGLRGHTRAPRRGTRGPPARVHRAGRRQRQWQDDTLSYLAPHPPAARRGDRRIDRLGRSATCRSGISSIRSFHSPLPRWCGWAPTAAGGRFNRSPRAAPSRRCLPRSAVRDGSGASWVNFREASDSVSSSPAR